MRFERVCYFKTKLALKLSDIKSDITVKFISGKRAQIQTTKNI